jgi:hypothetical protein
MIIDQHQLQLPFFWFRYKFQYGSRLPPLLHMLGLPPLCMLRLTSLQHTLTQADSCPSYARAAHTHRLPHMLRLPLFWHMLRLLLQQVLRLPPLQQVPSAIIYT